jgi:hypothetical protein
MNTNAFGVMEVGHKVIYFNPNWANTVIDDKTWGLHNVPEREYVEKISSEDLIDLCRDYINSKNKTIYKNSQALLHYLESFTALNNFSSDNVFVGNYHDNIFHYRQYPSIEQIPIEIIFM